MFENVIRRLYPVLLVIAVTVVAVILRGSLTLANSTLVYTLVVLVLAIQRGTRVALAAALVSFLIINFFLIHPYYTFLIADPREVLDLTIFFIVAVLAGQLAARARMQAYTAERRASEQEILYRLTRSFNQMTSSKQVQDALIDVVTRDLSANQAYLLPRAPEVPNANAPVHYLLLQSDNRIYGTLCVVFDTPPNQETIRLLTTCVSQAAMALHRIELDEQARKSQEFEEADRLKTAILRSVSHDLRTPITIIKTSASNLRTLGDRLSPDERAELSEAIDHEADQLDQLVGNLLDMSRLQAGSLTLNCEPNSLEEVAGEIAARVFHRTKQQRVRLSFPDDLPLVPFDYVLLLQALTNLVENALRYEPDDRQIEIFAHMEQDEVHLSVINHGETISVEERTQIMEPFYHGKKGNTGLGLAIAKGIIEAHHGRLWVTDTPGSGATFTIALKLEERDDNVIEGTRSG